jgi:hypothetical protein
MNQLKINNDYFHLNKFRYYLNILIILRLRQHHKLSKMEKNTTQLATIGSFIMVKKNFSINEYLTSSRT